MASALVEPLVFAGDIEVALVVDDDRRVGVVTGPEAEHLADVGSALEDVGDVPALDQATGVGDCISSALL